MSAAVLIVDDEPRFGELLIRWLAVEGYVGLQVRDVEAAREDGNGKRGN